MYVPMAENRKSITVIESICATGHALSPIIIVQGRQHMESWYNEKLTGNELVLLSETGYTNSELAMIFLDHFIKHTDAGPNKPQKVLLMDSHTSHTTPEFILRATEMNIHPYPFPSHLTHVMQPLDVGVFQPYKHWHKKAVQHAMRNLDIDYNVASFFRDLAEIRTNTFKKGTIQGAFREAGMWPINSKEALKKMKVYAPPERLPDSVQVPRTPTKFMHSELKLQHWQTKIPYLLSSPSAREWDSWARGTETVLARGELAVLQYDLLSTKVANQQKAKIKSRGVVMASNGPLTAADAWKRKNDKAKKHKEAQEKSASYKARVALNRVKREPYSRGVKARKAELARKREVSRLLKAKQEVPPTLLERILDPEKEAQEAELQEEANSQLISTMGWSQSQVDDDEETGFIRFDGLDADESSLFMDRELDIDDNLDPGLF
jgi:hypothetical protein